MCQTHTLQQYAEIQMYAKNSKYNMQLKSKENTSCKTRKALNIRKQTPINETDLE